MSKFEIDECDNKIWYNDSCQIHREDGPAIEYSCGDKAWYQNDLLHREDGPAIDLGAYKAYYYKDKKIECNSNEEFIKIIKLKAFW